MSIVVAFKVSQGINLKLLQLKANFVTDTEVKNINFVKEPASRKPFFFQNFNIGQFEMEQRDVIRSRVFVRQ